MNIQQIQNEIETAKLRRNQLILFCGEQSMKNIKDVADELQCPYVNLSLQLSEALMAVPISRRGRRVRELVDQIIQRANNDLIILGQIEILFLPDLQQDPLRLLEDLSRNTLLIVAWNGSYKNGQLSYAEPGHPEYRIYHEVDARIL